MLLSSVQFIRDTGKQGALLRGKLFINAIVA
jgi:hypothetical protein